MQVVIFIHGAGKVCSTQQFKSRGIGNTVNFFEKHEKTDIIPGPVLKALSMLERKLDLMIEYGTRDDETLEARMAAESVKERVYLSVKELCIGGKDVRSRLKVSVNVLMVLNGKVDDSAESECPLMARRRRPEVASKALGFLINCYILTKKENTAWPLTRCKLFSP